MITSGFASFAEVDPMVLVQPRQTWWVGGRTHPNIGQTGLNFAVSERYPLSWVGWRTMSKALVGPMKRAAVTDSRDGSGVVSEVFATSFHCLSAEVQRFT